MYGSWIKNVVLWRTFLGFIWDIKNVLMMYNYWFWPQIQRSIHPFGTHTTRETENREKDFFKTYHKK